MQNYKVILLYAIEFSNQVYFLKDLIVHYQVSFQQEKIKKILTNLLIISKMFEIFIIYLKASTMKDMKKYMQNLNWNILEMITLPIMM